MKKQLEEIEQRLMAVYVEIKKQYPALHNLSFEIATWKHNNKTVLHGFYHIGEECESYDNISEVYNLWHRHHTLFQKFDHIL